MKRLIMSFLPTFLPSCVRTCCFVVVLMAISLSAAAFSAAQLSQGAVVKIQKAFAFQEQEQWQQAINTLGKIRSGQAYDKAYIARMLGVLYWQQGDISRAMNALKRAVDSEVLTEDEHRSAQRMLADLLVMQGQYQGAVTLYVLLVKRAEGNEASELWLRMAQANYQSAHWRKAIIAVDKHLSFLPLKTALVAERVSPLTIKLGAQLQLKHWEKAIATLNQLIALEPTEKKWWLQLVGNYQRLNRQMDMLNTLVLAERSGIDLSVSERKLMAQLYSMKGAPERAAKILEAFSDSKQNAITLASQATYWQQAKEWDKAIAAWTLAAESDYTYRWPLAQLQMQQGLYRDTLSSLDRIEDEGKRAEVALLKANAYDKLKDVDNALLHAKRAHDISSTEQSKSWVTYLEKKQQLEEN